MIAIVSVLCILLCAALIALRGRAVRLFFSTFCDHIARYRAFNLKYGSKFNIQSDLKSIMGCCASIDCPTDID